MPQSSTIDLSALCNSSNSIWKTTESHRWVKLSCENIGMCLSYVPFTLVMRLINYWDFIQIWYDNKMLSSQGDNDNQHFVYIIVSWYLLGIITREGFLFSCSCMNRCTCLFTMAHLQLHDSSPDDLFPMKYDMLIINFVEIYFVTKRNWILKKREKLKEENEMKLFQSTYSVLLLTYQWMGVHVFWPFWILKTLKIHSNGYCNFKVDPGIFGRHI